MMRAFLLLALVALVVGLGALNANVARTSIDTSPIAASQPIASASGARRASSLGQEAAPLEAFSETIKRPLFAQSRRPAEARSVEPQKVSAPVEEETTHVNLRLSGIFHTGLTPRRALIVSTGEPNGRWLEEGGEIEGWRVVAIERLAVQITAGGRLKQLDMH